MNYLSKITFILLCVTTLAAPVASACGELVTVKTHGSTTTRYALSSPQPLQLRAERVALVLLAGGGGHLNLNDAGCPRALTGNSLVRSAPLFLQAGFFTALVDAPSDHPGEDGLAGFRVSAKHAEDLGSVISDVRRRTRASVWLIGTSRGSISAANAAASLSGESAPDGLVLTSALMSGDSSARKAWVAQSVFDLPLEKIRIPVLVVGHTEDRCIRSPAGRMPDITARTASVREQVVTVTGGPGGKTGSGLDACTGRSPHGFIEQEAEVVAGLARFIAGGSY